MIVYITHGASSHFTILAQAEIESCKEALNSGDKVMTSPYQYKGEHLRSIGRITVNFNSLEFEISRIVHRLISKELTVGIIVTTGMPFSRLLTLLTSLYIRFFLVSSKDKLPQEVQDLITHAGEAEEKRNLVVHSSWYEDTSGQIQRVKYSISKKRGLEIKQQPMTVNELDSIADFITIVALKAHKILSDIDRRSSLSTGILLSPLDKSLTDTQPVFSWTAVRSATGYEFLLSHDPHFSTPIVSKMGTNSLTKTVYVPEYPLDLETTYFWKVRVINPSFAGPWSPILSFATSKHQTKK